MPRRAATLPAALVLPFVWLLAACGIPGPPVPPTARIPLPVSDLEAGRAGDTVTLRFTLPTRNTDGSRIDGPVTVEVHGAYLGLGPDLEKGFAERAELLRVLPPDAAAAFRQGDRIAVDVPITPYTDPSRFHAAYAVRALDSGGESAGFSNIAQLRTYPAPPRPREFAVTVVEEGVRLSWTPIRKENVAAGYMGDVLIGYRIFRRGEGDPDFTERATIPASTAEVGEYIDRTIEWGSRYAYRLRTVTTFAGESAEGFDTEPVEVMAEDTFPPAPPQRLVAVGGPGRIDLSWDASPSADVVGYRISRMRAGKEDPIPAPLDPVAGLAFTDDTARAGVEYTYFVAAIDRSGNQSTTSNPATAATVAFEEE